MSHPIILHIEDESSDVLLLEQAFRQAKLGVRLQNLTDGETALAYLSGSGQFADRARYPLPDLVLLDLKLLGVSGFDVLRWLRGQQGFQTLPVVVLSATTKQAEINLSYQLGANSFLSKPVGFEPLVALAKALYHYWFELNHPPGR